MANKQLRGRIVEVTEDIKQCHNEVHQDAQIESFQDNAEEVVKRSMLAERETLVEKFFLWFHNPFSLALASLRFLNHIQLDKR
jgi:hypothetical protein